MSRDCNRRWDFVLKNCPDVEIVIVYRRTVQVLDLDSEREIWWHEAIADPELPSYVPPEPMS
jgi:hypothetical protein